MEAMETKNTGGVSTIKRTSTTQLYASPYSTLLMTPSLELPAAIFHNQPPDDASNTVKHVLSTIKALSSNSRLNPTAIVAQATRGLTPVEATLLPSKKSLKQVSQRAFKLDNPKKRSPATLAQIQHATYTC